MQICQSIQELYAVSPIVIWNKLERFTKCKLDQLPIKRSQIISNWFGTYRSIQISKSIQRWYIIQISQSIQRLYIIQISQSIQGLYTNVTKLTRNDCRLLHRGIYISKRERRRKLFRFNSVTTVVYRSLSLSRNCIL